MSRMHDGRTSAARRVIAEAVILPIASGLNVDDPHHWDRGIGEAAKKVREAWRGHAAEIFGSVAPSRAWRLFGCRQGAFRQACHSPFCPYCHGRRARALLAAVTAAMGRGTWWCRVRRSVLELAEAADMRLLALGQLLAVARTPRALARRRDVVLGQVQESWATPHAVGGILIETRDLLLLAAGASPDAIASGYRRLHAADPVEITAWVLKYPRGLIGSHVPADAGGVQIAPDSLAIVAELRQHGRWRASYGLLRHAVARPKPKKKSRRSQVSKFKDSPTAALLDAHSASHDGAFKGMSARIDLLTAYFGVQHFAPSLTLEEFLAKVDDCNMQELIDAAMPRRQKQAGDGRRYSAEEVCTVLTYAADAIASGPTEPRLTAKQLIGNPTVVGILLGETPVAAVTPPAVEQRELPLPDDEQAVAQADPVPATTPVRADGWTPTPGRRCQFYDGQRAIRGTVVGEDRPGRFQVEADSGERWPLALEQLEPCDAPPPGPPQDASGNVLPLVAAATEHVPGPEAVEWDNLLRHGVANMEPGTTLRLRQVTFPDGCVAMVALRAASKGADGVCPLYIDAFVVDGEGNRFADAPAPRRNLPGRYPLFVGGSEITAYYQLQVEIR